MLQAQIFIDMEQRMEEQSLHDYILQFLLEHNIIGATSFKGLEGFGQNHKIKRPNELFSFDEPPVMIVFIDQENKVRSVLAELRARIHHGFFAVSQVETF